VVWRPTDRSRERRSLLATRASETGSRRTSEAFDETAELGAYRPAGPGPAYVGSLGGQRRVVSVSGARLSDRALAPAGKVAEGRPRGWRMVVGSTVSRLTWALAGLLVVVALVAMVALTAAAVPAATIRITPAIEQREVTMTYALDLSSAVDWVAPSRLVSVPIEVRAGRATTGEKQVPDGTASGRVRFVNASLQPVQVSAETRLTGANGITYRVTEDVIVPAADPFGSQAFGVADGKVVADVPGPDGNAAIGTVAGQLGDGVLYRNIEPLTGGSLRTVRFVTEDDVATLRKQLEQSLAERVTSALQAALLPGETLVEGTIHTETPEIQIDQKVGDESENLTGTGKLVVTARVYDPAAVHRAAQEEAAKRLAQATGTNVVLIGNTLAFGDPEAIGANQWRVRATAQVRLVPASADLERLRREVAGQSLDQARRMAQTIAGVASVEIEVRPDWWPKRLPDRASRIEVVVSE